MPLHNFMRPSCNKVRIPTLCDLIQFMVKF